MERLAQTKDFCPNTAGSHDALPFPLTPTDLWGSQHTFLMNPLKFILERLELAQ